MALTLIHKGGNICFLSKSSLRFTICLGIIIIAHSIPVSLISQTSSEKCLRMTLRYDHCGNYQDGVRELRCFGRLKLVKKVKDWECVWQPGNHTMNKSYTLIILQEMNRRSHCPSFNNLSGVSQKLHSRVDEGLTLTAHIIDNSDPRNCTKALFSGLPRQLVQCGPPHNATFSRMSGRLEINATWQQTDSRAIQNYNVRYRTPGSLQWTTSVKSKDVENCIVENVNSSLDHEVQIQCVFNEICSQCPWSKSYMIPPELTVQPVILTTEDDVIPEKGQRLTSLTWKVPSKELVEGYSVIIEKASGEGPRVRINTIHPEIKLVLSLSAYRLHITAVNRVSTSPAARQTILPPENSIGAGKLNVTFNSNTSFTLSWKDDLIKSYSCYSVEWYSRAHETQYMSFYENSNNYKVISLKEHLEPYEKYSISLHTRVNNDTCNIKHINNTESTYGRIQLYFIEGAPISAPTNISISNVTVSSMVLHWMTVPEEDIRGVLLGYMIFYKEYHHRDSSTEKNMTVDPMSNSHELGGLNGGTVYMVQILAFTRTGRGTRSPLSYFETNPHGSVSLGSATAAVVTVFILICLIQLVSPLCKSAKTKFWPSIPNPGKSNAIQKIDGSSEQEIQRYLVSLETEEWETNSLHIVEKGPETMTSELLPPILLNLAYNSEDEGNSDSEQLSNEGLNMDWLQRETETASGGLFPHITVVASPDMQQSLSFPAPSDYTTLEMIQQAMPNRTPGFTTVNSPVSSSGPAGTEHCTLEPDRYGFSKAVPDTDI